MAGYTLNYVGWCKDVAGHHDKIWGYVTRGEGSESVQYNFWGRRGRSLTFQRHDGKLGAAELERLVLQKDKKGYMSLTESQVNTVWPDFRNEMEKQHVIAKLFGKVHDEPDAWQTED